MMETTKKCEYYSTRKVYSGLLDYPFPKIVGECLGTKECEECKCGGDQKKCDFYSYIRENAKEKLIEYLTRQEIVDIVNKAACACGKKVPEEFYKALYERR